MHELSIATSLVELGSAAAERAGAARVGVVYLRLGALAGVVREALEFSFELAAADTLLAGARLEIEELPVRVYCPACRAESVLPDIQRFRCPACGAPTSQIVQGRELELAALEYDEAPAAELA
jgi:hydrogenase nickel incorporation protein HypA/HybF